MRIVVALFLFLASLGAGEIYIAGGAGYKRPITELATLFEKGSAHKVKMMFGNMQQVSAQIKESDKIAFFFGDEAFVRKLAIPHQEKIALGSGRLMLVLAKGIALKPELDSLKDRAIKAVGIPDTKSAVYGIAGSEALKNAGLSEAIASKLKVLQTVPQVSAYLVSGDLEAGFINKTDYLGIREKVGEASEVSVSLYTPIRIIAAWIEGRDSAEIREFASFLRTPEAQAVFARHGL